MDTDGSGTVITAATTDVATGAAAAARAALGASPPWRETTIDGVRLAYDDEGDGPAIVCLHAIGHGAGDFRRLRARLSRRHRVIALDWPGQGRSGDDRVPPTAARYADLLDGLLDALQVHRCVIIGNSIGGATALRYAATHPHRVRALVVENSGGLDRPDRLAALVVGAMVRFFSTGVRRARWYPTAFGAYYRLVLPGRPAAAQRARIIAAAFEIAPLLAQAWRGFGEPSADLRPLIDKVGCPVLFAWAVRDRFVQLRRSLPSIRRFSNARLQRFRAGHAAHLETPDAFESAVETFLEELRPLPTATEP